VLAIVEPIDRFPAEPNGSSRKSSIYSLLLSLLFHGVLAVVLWCIVYGTTRRQSISLTASAAAATSPGDAVFELAAQAKPVRPEVGPGQATSVDSSVEIKSLISKSMKSDLLSETIRDGFEPPSIEFFGTRAYGNRFVFVLDISYSMDARDGERFSRACDELVRSVSKLRPGQSYYVFVFCWTTEEMFYDPVVKYVEVGPQHDQKLRKWIYSVSLGAGTDPRRALALAHRMKPDTVFLLSDGHFNRPSSPKSETGWIDETGERFKAGVQEGVEMVFRDVPIHTVAFENPFTLAAMQHIATSTGGNCRYVPTRSHKPIDSSRFLTTLRHIDQKHRHDRRPQGEYLTRLSYAREFIRDGELAYAEYLVRPLRHAKESMISNPVLLAQVVAILDFELGGTRLEDFESPPELREILGQDS
jgi:hypothetical protein